MPPEITSSIRHIATTAAALLAAHGLVAESMTETVTTLVAAVLTLGVSVYWSGREKRKAESRQPPTQDSE